MNKLIYISILAFFVWLLSLEQSPAAEVNNFESSTEVDSLINQYKTAAADTSKIHALFALENRFYLSDPDTAIYFSEQALRISLAANLKKESAHCYGLLAYYMDDKGDVDKALEYNMKSIDLFKELMGESTIKEDIDGYKGMIATIYSNVGVLYYYHGEIEKALKNYYLGMRLREEVNDKRELASSYNNIGTILQSQKEMYEALESYQMGLKLRKECGDSVGISYSYNNIANLYKEQLNLDSALQYYYWSLDIKKRINDKIGMAYSYDYIGRTLCEQDSLIKGMIFLNKALALRTQLANIAGIASSNISIGTWHYKQGQINQALQSGKKALIVAEEIGNVDHINGAAALLSNVYKEMGIFKDALIMYELHIRMRDSLKNDETQKTAIRQQTKYQFEKAQLVKEQEEKEVLRLADEETSRRDNLQYSIIFISLLLVFGGVLSLGFIKVSPKVAEGLIFFSFLILFEFVLVLADPYVDQYSGGAPGYKLLFNAVLAGGIFPMHAFFERILKLRLIRKNR